MILLDALYINESGGLRLLEYLVDELIVNDVDFFLLADVRCIGKFDYCKHVKYMPASLIERTFFYKKKADCFTKVLCFGNIPSPVKLDVPVYTYFHNINLLTLSEAQTKSLKIKSWLKRQIFRHYKSNTKYWFVQTSNTADELICHLGEHEERVKLMPFYKIPSCLDQIEELSHGNDYVYISINAPGKGHKELIEAWEILHGKGIDNALHLTIPDMGSSLEKRIIDAQERGVNIVNHGFIPFEKVFELYGQSKAIIYPSHNESLGLGIVEAITAGCDVIGANLPYIHSICKPSEVFNPYSPESIADAVMRYESGLDPKSELLIYNHIDEIIEILKE